MNTITVNTPTMSSAALGTRRHLEVMTWRDMIHKGNALVWSLSMAVFIAALAVIVVKNTERSLYNQLQVAEARADKLQVEWGKLLLEQSTLARPNRVHSVAVENYVMHVPQADEVTVVEV